MTKVKPICNLYFFVLVFMFVVVFYNCLFVIGGYAIAVKPSHVRE